MTRKLPGGATLYLMVLAGLLFLVITALGNGPWQRPADYGEWRYQMFRGVCHQLPERSLHINSEPMAVNARCFGIFSGLLVGWVLIPLVSSGSAKYQSVAAPSDSNRPVYIVRKVRRKPLLLLILALNIAEWSTGHLSVWNSSNFSRFFLGAWLGFLAAGVVVGRPDVEAQKGTEKA